MSGKNFILHQTTSLQREIQNTKAVECAAPDLREIWK